jgi:type I restriction enzyme S subunit
MQFALGQNLVLLRADGEVIFPPFLRWLVRTSEWWNQVGRFINVGAVFNSLKCADIPKFELPIPPLDEQRAIAHILGTLDDKIELNRRMNETLEAMARAIFKSWFVDFDPVRAKASGEPPESICRRLGLTPDVLALFPDSLQDSELGEIPEGWPVRSIGELCDRVAMGPFGSNIKTTNFVPTGVPIIRGGNLANGFVDDRFVFLTEEKADQLRNSNARPGDIVITHRGTLGQVGLIPSDCRYSRYVVSQSQMVLSVRSDIASSRYLYEFLRSPIGQQALLANTSQVGVPAIAQPTTSVKAIRIAAPPVAVLRAYGLATKSLFDHASAVGKQSATLAAIRDSLLPKLLSGELAPSNFVREGATV